jgi:hypothetical protein
MTDTITRFALGLIKFDPAQDDATYDALPGRCVFGYTDYEQASPLVMTREPPQPKPRFCALLEVPLPGDAQPQVVQRRFISVSFGALIDWPGELRHFWTFVNPQTGAVRAIYEVVTFDEAEAARRIAAHTEATTEP